MQLHWDTLLGLTKLEFSSRFTPRFAWSQDANEFPTPYPIPRKPHQKKETTSQTRLPGPEETIKYHPLEGIVPRREWPARVLLWVLLTRLSIAPQSGNHQDVI